jgi:hypothetical protein
MDAKSDYQYMSEEIARLKKKKDVKNGVLDELDDYNLEKFEKQRLKVLKVIKEAKANWRMKDKEKTIGNTWINEDLMKKDEPVKNYSEKLVPNNEGMLDEVSESGLEERMKDFEDEIIEILKEVERRSDERERLELKEAEACVNNSLSEDLDILVSIRTCWLLNETDREMWIFETEGRLYAVFNNDIFGSMRAEEYYSNMKMGSDIEFKQLWNLIMFSAVRNGIIDADLTPERKNRIWNAVHEFYNISEGIKARAEILIQDDLSESEVQRVSEMLVNFPEWLSLLYKGMIENGFVKIVEKKESVKVQ